MLYLRFVYLCVPMFLEHIRDFYASYFVVTAGTEFTPYSLFSYCHIGKHCCGLAISQAELAYCTYSNINISSVVFKCISGHKKRQ